MKSLFLSFLAGISIVLSLGGTAEAQRAAPDRGKLLFNRCRACHTLEADAKPRLGPHLAGLFGREAGSVPRYAYSKALQGAEFRWSDEKLDAWLKSPNSFLPGNRMNFAGVPSPEDRAALIAYLKSATKAPQSE